MFEKIAVLGVGAIGSVIGAHLSKAGLDVTLIDHWGQHIDQMKSQGLTITHEDGDSINVSVNAEHLGDVSSLETQFDLVFLAVKSYDTEWATHFILPHMAPTGIIVSAQNGINDDLIAEIIGASRELPCVMTFGAGLYEPGHGLRTGDRSKTAFIIGESSGVKTPRIEALSEILNNVGICEISSNIWGHRWAKLAVNCMANPMCAASGLGSKALRQDPNLSEISIGIAAEVVNTGISLGVNVEKISGVDSALYQNASTDMNVMEEIKTQLATDAVRLGEGRPSMAQDVMKGRRTEISHLNGYVSTRGKELGVETPICESIVELVQKVEKGVVEPGENVFGHIKI